ncbi:MAG: dual specificity protein phosphatase family protein [Nitrospiria bacterium]
MSIGGPSKILENLYLGDWQDGLSFDGDVINVLDKEEMGEDQKFNKNAIWIPVVEYLHISAKGVSIPRANITRLDSVLKLVDTLLAEDLKVLIHCGAGMERSPLAVVWILRQRNYMTTEDAYEYVMKKDQSS